MPQTNPDSVRLIEEARSGAIDALGELYTAYSSAVYQLAYRLTASYADADDVLQEVFIGLPRALRSYQEQGKFLSWLKRLTARTALMRLRAVTRRREDPIDSIAQIGGPVEAPAVDRITLDRALEAMPAKLRIAFMLKEIEGYSHAEVAEFVGITSAASAKRVSRAWDFLRKEVGQS